MNEYVLRPAKDAIVASASSRLKKPDYAPPHPPPSSKRKTAPPLPPRAANDYDDDGHARANTSTPINTDNEPAMDISNAKRRVIFQELCSTEATYVNALKTLIDEYRVPSRGLLSKKDHAQFFPGHVPYLYDFHSDLLARLQARLETFTPESVLGDLFTRLPREFFNHYALYNSNLSNMNQMLETFVKIKPLLDQDGTRHAFDSMTFNSYLLCPTQRLGRYILLLKDLAQHTPAGHNDACFINHAVILLERNTTDVNEQLKQFESNLMVMKMSREIKNAPKWLYRQDRYIIRQDRIFYHAGHNDLREGILYIMTNLVLITTERKRRAGSIKKNEVRDALSFEFLKVERTLPFHSISSVTKAREIIEDGCRMAEVVFVLTSTERSRVLVYTSVVDTVVKFLSDQLRLTQQKQEQPLFQV